MSKHRSMPMHRVAVRPLVLAAAAVSLAPVSLLAGCTATDEDRGATASAPEPEARRVERPADPSANALLTSRAPVVKRRVVPDYPADPRANGISGKVFVRLTIGADGRVDDAVVTRRSHEDTAVFDEVALAAARQWTFEPTTVDGDPAGAQVVIPFSFAAR